MPIPIEPDPDPDVGPWLERCCFCRKPTRYWTNMKRRKPGAQVACCQECAATHHQKDVPTKKAWCDKEAAIMDGTYQPPAKSAWERLGETP